MQLAGSRSNKLNGCGIAATSKKDFISFVSGDLSESSKSQSLLTFISALINKQKKERLKNGKKVS